MALLDGIKKFLGMQINSALSTTLNNYQFINLSNMEIYPEINIQRAIDLGFEGNSAVYSIVSKSAKKFAAIPRYVNQTDPKGKVDYKQLEKLINLPNPYQGADAFNETLDTYKLITGETFIWLNRGDITGVDGKVLPDDVIDKMPVLEMYVLPSNFVFIVPDDQNVFGVKGYIFLVSGTRIKIRKNDVIHWKNVNTDFDAVSRQHLRGMSPLTPGYRSLQANNAAIDATVRMHQNDGAKGILFQRGEPFEVTPEQNSQLRQVMNSKINTNDSKGALVALQGGEWEHIDLASSMDLKLIQAREFSWKELCALFDVPYELFQSDTAYANKEWAQKNWVSNTILPAAKQFDDELNRSLLQAFNLVGLVYIESDASGLAELQRDLSYLATALSNAPYLTMNEKRIAMGYEAFDDPSFDQPWIPAGPLPLNEIQNEIQTVNQINAQPKDTTP